MLSNSYALDDIHTVFFVSDVYHTKIDEQALVHTFYTREGIYDTVTQEFYISLDVSLAMRGSKDVVESYCSVMKSQQFDGGQSTETLALHTNGDGNLPLPA